MDSKYTRSRFYKSATRLAAQTAKNPGKLSSLVDEAAKKAQKYRNGSLQEAWQNLTVSLRLIKAYAKREYTDVAWQNLILIIGAIIYFVMPLDSIPDFLIHFGLIDDVALLIWTFATVKNEIERFKVWEASKVKLEDVIGADNSEETDAEETT